MMKDAWIREIKFDNQGLIPAVIQDQDSKNVLMVGYMNLQALQRTLETEKVHFWSRSRGALWCKGETSGHFQELAEVRLDCDGDALLVRVKQKVACCHTGYRSCFFRVWTSEGWKEVGKKAFDPGKVYGLR
jgi:phosphoribosyl-AMP cyclohydrolase